MTKQNTVLIATYGSLRRGMENERVNERGGGKFLSMGVTVENFDLYQYGGGYFPSVSLTHNASKKPVVVDVYEAPMSGLTGAYDQLEGYPDFYNRTEVEVKLDNGEIVKAWMYHIDEEQPVKVDSGDWCLFKNADYYL